MHAQRRRLLVAAVTGSLLLGGGAGALSASAAQGKGRPAAPGKDPGGNNGTVKIDRLPLDAHPGNEPHVGCDVGVDFYGFDQGDLTATVTFEAQPPTLPAGGRSRVLLTDRVFVGEDSAAGGGSAAGLDAAKVYRLDLRGIAPHPKQGVHVKLTVHAPGSRGADVKHKVFWVSGCAGTPTPTPSGSPSPSVTPSPTPGATPSGGTPVPQTGPGGGTPAPGGGPSGEDCTGAAASGADCVTVGGNPGFTG